MQIAIFSDLHLGVKSDSPEWHTIAKEWVSEMIEYLKEHNIKHVFFLGDWFHTRASVGSSTLSCSVDIMEMFSGFKLYVFPGNHDLFFSKDPKVSSVSVLKGYSNINFYDEITKIELGGHEITICPFGLDPLEHTVQPTEYLFGHFEINTFLLNSASSTICENGLSITELLQKFPKVYSGHFHKMQEKVYTNGYILYVGAPFQMNYGDSGEERGFFVLDLDNNTHKFVKNRLSPRFCKVPASTILRTPETHANESLRGNYVQIVVDVDDITPEEIGKIQSKITYSGPRDFEIQYPEKVKTTVNGKSLDELKSTSVIETINEYIMMEDNEFTSSKEELIEYIGNIYEKVTIES